MVAPAECAMKYVRLILLLMLAIGGVAVWRTLQKKDDATKAPDPKKSIPVTTITADVRDVPIWFTGLGTVQAYNKVTIRPRVGGVLDHINFTEGQTVNEGDILATIDPRPYESHLAEAQAKVAQTAAQLTNAIKEVERNDKLVKSGAVSHQLLDQLEANVAQLTAQKQADMAAMNTAQLDLDFTTVKAPIAGKTGMRLIDQGNLVTASQDGGLVVISQIRPISVVFTVPQDNLTAIRKRMSIDPSELTVQAMTNDGQVLAEGKLALIDNEIDVNSGTLKLKATFPNTDETLWPGQFLNARVLVETRMKAVVIPTQVITAGLNGPLVYLVKPDLTVEARTVKPGPEMDGFTLIEEGLDTGEQVVLEGQNKLQPGSHVSIQPAKQ
jgi:multidrug efflux system membrane fusion protein